MNPRTYINIFLSVVLVFSGALPCYADELQYESLWNSEETDTNHVQDQEPVQESTEDFAAVREARILNAEAEYEANNPVRRPDSEEHFEAPEQEQYQEEAINDDFADTGDSADSGLSVVPEIEYSLDCIEVDSNVNYSLAALSADTNLLTSINNRLGSINNNFLPGSLDTSYITFTIHNKAYQVACNSALYPIAYSAFALNNMWTTLNSVSKYTYGIWDDLYTNFPVNGETDPPNRKLVNLVAMLVNRAYILVDYLKDVRSNTSAISAYTSNIRDYLTTDFQLATDKQPIKRKVSDLVGHAVNRLIDIQGYSRDISSNTSNISSRSDSIDKKLVSPIGLSTDGTPISRNITDYVAHAVNRLIDIQGYSRDISSAANSIIEINQGIKNDSGYISSYTSDIRSYLTTDFLLSTDKKPLRRKITDLIGHLVNRSIDIQGLENTNTSQNNRIIELLEGLQNLITKVNLDGTNDILERIERLLIAAGVIENTKDVLDVLIGEFDITGSIDNAVTELSASVEKAFPFNMVFIVIEVLNLLVVDAELPVLEFEIFGSPLSFDMNNDFTYGLGEVTSWVSLITFVVLLFANTKKFIIGWGDGQ